MNLITALVKSIPAILTGAFWLSAFKCVAITVISLISFIWLVGSMATDLISTFDIGWVSIISMVAMYGGGTVIAWLLFPAVLPLIASFFQDSLLNKLEKSEYDLEKPNESHSKLLTDILFVFKVIGINILLLPVLMFPPVYFILYYIANGYMLGTEFFRVIADRRISREQSNQLIEENKLTIYATGMLITFFTNIPVINVILPLIAVVLMMHVFYIIQENKSI